MPVPAGTEPVLILPGFACCTSDYKGLLENLNAAGLSGDILQVSRGDWAKATSRKKGDEVPGYSWYLERVRSAVSSLKRSHSTRQVVIIAHSAGGWLAREFISNPHWRQEPPAAKPAPPLATNSTAAASATPRTSLSRRISSSGRTSDPSGSAPASRRSVGGSMSSRLSLGGARSSIDWASEYMSEALAGTHIGGGLPAAAPGLTDHMRSGSVDASRSASGALQIAHAHQSASRSAEPPSAEAHTAEPHSGEARPMPQQGAGPSRTSASALCPSSASGAAESSGAAAAAAAAAAAGAAQKAAQPHAQPSRLSLSGVRTSIDAASQHLSEALAGTFVGGGWHEAPRVADNLRSSREAAGDSSGPAPSASKTATSASGTAPSASTLPSTMALQDGAARSAADRSAAWTASGGLGSVGEAYLGFAGEAWLGTGRLPSGGFGSGSAKPGDAKPGEAAPALDHNARSGSNAGASVASTSGGTAASGAGDTAAGSASGAGVSAAVPSPAAAAQASASPFEGAAGGHGSAWGVAAVATGVPGERHDSEGGPHPSVKMLVTLGTPQRPPPDKKKDPTGGALTNVDARYPGAFFPALPYLCVCGDKYVGHPAHFWELAQRFTNSSYESTCGAWDGVAGDGLVPASVATLQGAENLVLETAHGPGVFYKNVKWYGEASIVDQWLPKVLEILVPSAKLAAVTE